MIHFIQRFADAAKKNWHKPAVCDYNGDVFLYADVVTQIARIHTLFRRLGVNRGDKVAICANNSARWAVAYLSTTSYGAVAVPILNGFTADNLERLVDHSDSVVLFTEPKIWETMHNEAMPKLKATFNINDFSALWSPDGKLEEIIANIHQLLKEDYPSGIKRETASYEPCQENELVTISYTSGTTSSPKGIMLSAGNISSNITFGVERIKLPQGSSVVSMLPLAHLYGLAFEFIYPICQGATVHFLGKTPTPTLLMQAFQSVKPYMLITVPLVLEKIFRNKVIPTLEQPAMRFALKVPMLRNIIYKKVCSGVLNSLGGNMHHIIVGGAAISGQVEVLLKRIKLPYTVGYGMTECAPLIGYEDWYNFAIRSCGKPVDGMEVRIDSANPQKEVGEIQVRGRNVMMGYYKMPEATAAAFTEDGWMRTGDLGIIDKHGNIYIKGRSKNMILTSNGQNIYPEEIEELLNVMSHIHESIIIERNGRLVAIVAVDNDPSNPLSQNELEIIMKSNLILLNRQLPAYSQVTDIEILEEDFERTPKNSIKRFLYK